MIQPVFTNVSQVDIREPVVVVVTHLHALAETMISQATFRGHILETTVTQVAEQPIPVLLSIGSCRPQAALGQVNVGPEVPVIVQDCHATTGKLEHAPTLGRRIIRVEILELDTNFTGNIRKDNLGNRGLFLAATGGTRSPAHVR